MNETSSRPPARITLLTGFLGAGKTTLLNRLLSGPGGDRIAVLENEFAQLGIDQHLLGHEAAVVEASTGSICCTSRADLTLTLARLARQRDRFDHLVIETTGMADPAPILHAFFTDDELTEQFTLGAIVTVVDARHAAEQLATLRESRSQIGLADVLVINKTDLVTSDRLDALQNALRELNPWAERIVTTHGTVAPDVLLGPPRFELSRALRHTPHLLEDTSHEHDSDIAAVCLEVEGTMNERKLRAWLDTLLNERGPDILRLKGFLLVGDGRCLLVQGVQQELDVSEVTPGQAGPSSQDSRLVFIGRGLAADELQESLLACR